MTRQTVVPVPSSPRSSASVWKPTPSAQHEFCTNYAQYPPYALRSWITATITRRKLFPTSCSSVLLFNDKAGAARHPPRALGQRPCGTVRRRDCSEMMKEIVRSDALDRVFIGNWTILTLPSTAFPHGLIGVLHCRAEGASVSRLPGALECTLKALQDANNFTELSGAAGRTASTHAVRRGLGGVSAPREHHRHWISFACQSQAATRPDVLGKRV